MIILLELADVRAKKVRRLEDATKQSLVPGIQQHLFNCATMVLITDGNRYKVLKNEFPLGGEGTILSYEELGIWLMANFATK